MARKQVVLLHNLRVEGRSIYDSLETFPIGNAEGNVRDVFDMSVLMLEKHF